MDWDASYLQSMGTMDADTEEYYAVFMAMQNLEQACTRLSENAKPGSVLERGEAVLRAYHAYNDAGWDV